MPTFPEQPEICRQLIADPSYTINPEWVENALVKWIHDHLNEFFAVNPHLRHKAPHNLYCHCSGPILPEERTMCRNLLTDPSCTIKSEWTESALVDWICDHMNEFLAVNPHLYQKAARSRGWFYSMAPIVPITDENEPLLETILEECCGNQMYVLCDRLLRHGKIDLIAEIPPWKFIGCDEWLNAYVNKLDKESLIKIMRKIPWRECVSFKKTVLAIIKRLSTDELMSALELDGEETIPRMAREYHSLNDITRIVAMLLKKLPVRIASAIAHYCQWRMPLLICMKCGSDSFSYESAMQQHRKKCDPNNRYPSIQEIMNKRLTAVQ